MMTQETILCLDIGGTHCRIGLVSKDGTLTDSRVVPTGQLGGVDFLENLTGVLESCRVDSSSHILAVSLGFPATIDRTRRVVLQAPNIPGLPERLSVCDVLEEALGIPAFLERDVNLQLAYDLKQLGLEDSDTVIGIYFGTGIGNSIYMGGRFHNGCNGVAGELGHIPQLYSDVTCGCGNTGCMEPLGGGRKLMELCRDVFADTEISEIYLRHGHTPEVREQIDAMAAAVATEVNILDPDYVVLGGGLVQMEGFPREFFEARIRARTRKPLPFENLRLVYAEAGQESGVLGAGIHGWSQLQARRKK